MTVEAQDFARRRVMVAIPGGEMSVLRYGEKGAPPLLFAHANGFCASAYRQMFEALGPRFDIFGVDLRGYGATSLPIDPNTHHSMDIFADDVRALLSALTERFAIAQKWVLAGHSLGGATVTLAAVGRGDIAALRLIEPVAMPWRLALLARSPLWRVIKSDLPLVRAARGRRAVWADRASVKSSYATKPFFSTWAEGALDDYLADGLRERGDGVELSCSPAWEAATFAGQAHDFWSAIKKAPAPVTVLAADHKTTTVPGPSIHTLEKHGVTVVRAPGNTHLIPLESPKFAADFLAGT
ncbi:MAG: alpha/beta hydrolase [Pseudomonadota bacterium]